jgi:hypothetical protein
MHLVLEAIPFVCLVKLPFDTTFPIQVRFNASLGPDMMEWISHKTLFILSDTFPAAIDTHFVGWSGVPARGMPG